MSTTVQALIRELDERTIAQRVGIPLDNARVSFHIERNTVRTYAEFEDITSQFVQHLHRKAITPGGCPSASAAASIAKDILRQEGRRHGHGGDDLSSYYDCLAGVNDGLLNVLRIITENLKAQAIEHNMRAVFDRYLPPYDPARQKDLLLECRQHYPELFRGIEPNMLRADRLEEIIRVLLRNLRQISTIFGRR